MKHLLSFVLIAIFLTACNSTQPAPTVSFAMILDTPTPDTPTPTPEATATPTETPTPEITPTETFAPMDLGTEKEHAQCNGPEDFAKGSPRDLTENEVIKSLKMPEDATVTGYEQGYPAETWNIELSKGSIDAVGAPISFCDLPKGSFGTNDKLVVVTLPWLSKDKTLRKLHFVINDSNPKLGVTQFLQYTSESQGRYINIVELFGPKWAEKWGTHRYSEYSQPLYESQGADEIFQLCQQLYQTGNIPEELVYKLLEAFINPFNK